MYPAGERSPIEAVHALLTRPRGPSGARPAKVMRSRLTLVPSGRPPVPAVSEMVAIDGPIFTVDPATIQILKQRELVGRHLFAVSYELAQHAALGGARLTSTRLVVAEPAKAGGGWTAFTSCSIGSRRPRGSTDEPYVSFQQDWTRERFYASGRIFRGAADVALVRLRFVDAVELEADTVGDIALFSTPRAVDPRRISIELCDSARRVVATL